MKILAPRPWKEWEKERIAGVFPETVFLEPVGNDGQKIEDLAAQADVLYELPDLPMDRIARLTNLKLVHIGRTGVDAILTQGFRDSPIALTNSRGVQAEPVAEHALALMFSVAYGLGSDSARQKARLWEATPPTRLYGKTAGLLGLGAIGQAIAQRCKGLNMEVVGLRRQKNGPVPHVDTVLPPEDLTDLLSRSDFLLCSLPLTQETKHFLTLREFSTMKPSAYLISVGRGAVIKEEDLVQALFAGAIAGAGLDVFQEEPLPASSPLWGMENVVITPHCAGKAPENEGKSMDIFVENLGRLQRGEPLINLVDKKAGY